MNQQKPRLLFICPTVAAYIGGTETVVSQFCHRLKDQAQLTLLSGDPGTGHQRLIALDGVELLTLPFVARDSRLNHVLSKILMTSRFKIESYSFFRALKQSGMDLSRYDYIVTFYEADAYLLSKRYPALRARFRHFLPGVSMRGFFRQVPPRDVFYLGYRAAEKTKRKWGLDIASLPLGVDDGFFPASPPPYPSDKRLLYIGRLDGSKNVAWLAEFFTQSGLAQQGYQLDIVGDGPLLEGLLAKYGSSPSLTFHGRKRQEEVVGLLRHAFLLLHPTDLESFGLTILEGMAAGVPVLTHELDSIKIWAKDHPRYPAHLDAAAWRSEILKFEQSAYWRAVSASSLEYAKSFTWDRVAAQVLQLITHR
ncbi:Glycosyltransferase involved in cell wall bisynthesis [Duganella sp. CF458]|uniref:glycosyltransferase family 4 protein n=1 Tax=Duganella sp. CF458 TaxID=1884368 RepID=UPI0008E8DA57|nr:glycosyltransferase family 4 protein [Duganella sp. CF458]SFG38309.1 Glycosyltransferase involved in cell wall bisynthesis [Duganella sp. CF458]